MCGDALPHLKHLRQLVVCSLPPAVCEALPRCSLQVLGVWPPKRGAVLPTALPSGPWLAELQELSAPEALLHASIPQLRTAARLQHVAVLQAAACDDGLRAIVSWAAGHTPLRLLAIGGTQAMLPAAWGCVLEAQRRRPDLCILPCTDAFKEVAARRKELEVPL